MHRAKECCELGVCFTMKLRCLLDLVFESSLQMTWSQTLKLPRSRVSSTYQTFSLRASYYLVSLFRAYLVATTRSKLRKIRDHPQPCVVH